MISEFATRSGFPAEKKKFNSHFSESLIELPDGAEKVCLVWPQTYMNLSGHSVRSFIGYFLKGEENNLEGSLLVIHDDLDLPEGTLRFKASGSSGGHKGLKSILEHVGHDHFGRLKIGIGRNTESDTRDYVLDKVSGESRDALNRAIERSSGAISTWLHEGIQASMNRFNQTED